MTAKRSKPAKKAAAKRAKKAAAHAAANDGSVQAFLAAEARSYGIPEEELTGGMLIFGKQDGDAAHAAGVAGIQLAQNGDGGSESLDRVKVVVVKPRDVPSIFSAAAAVAGTGVIMRPERYLYAVQDFEVPVEIPSALLAQTQSPTSDASILEYLRGYRDACSQIYEIVRNAKLGGGSGAAGVSEATALEWNLEVTGVLRSSATGQGIRIAILDTGIDPNHPDFTAGRILMTESFIDGEDVNDGHSHGTHCAGTAAGPRMPSRPPRYGAAFESGLLIAKVLGNAGRAAESSVLDGLNWAIENGANIISMSLAGRVNPGAPADPLFEEVAKDALDEGILIIAAAGNDSRRDLGLVRPVSHPANCPSVMAVGSVGPRLKVSAFSNGGMNTFGGGIDIAAPGEGILSSIPTRMGFYGRKNGTSMATPLVAGIAAMYAQNDPKLRGQALWDVLVRSSLPLQEAGDAVGAGLVQAPH